MTKLSDFWEKSVPKRWKHLVPHMNKTTMQISLDKFKKNTLEVVDVNNMSAFMDWGTGGGLLAKEILKNNKDAELYLVDISQESISSAQEFLAAFGDEKPYFLVDEGFSHVLLEKECDMLFCYSVIQHFPGVDYWDSVSSHWANKIKPKYISIRTKFGEESLSNDKYYDDAEYLRGTILNWDSLMKNFKDYKVLHRKEEISRSRQKEIFIVLEKKGDK